MPAGRVHPPWSGCERRHRAVVVARNARTTANARDIGSAARSRLPLAIEFVSLFFLEIDEVLALLLIAAAHVLLAFDDVSAFANVMADGHLLRARAGVAYCALRLLDTAGHNSSGRCCFIHLKRIEFSIVYLLISIQCIQSFKFHTYYY